MLYGKIGATMTKPKISIVVAIGRDAAGNRVIGKENGLLWYIRDDLKRFRELTVGHPVIMGRKTFESVLAILGKPFPNRTNIIITRNNDWNMDGVHTAHSLEAAVKKASESESQEIFIVGGAQIYEQALPLTDRLYLTLINDSKEGTAFFPAYENEFTKKISEEKRIDTQTDLSYTWLTLERA